MRSQRVAATEDFQREHGNHISVLFVGEKGFVLRPIGASVVDVQDGGYMSYFSAAAAHFHRRSFSLEPHVGHCRCIHGRSCSSSRPALYVPVRFSGRHIIFDSVGLYCRFEYKVDDGDSDANSYNYQ